MCLVNLAQGKDEAVVVYRPRRHLLCSVVEKPVFLSRPTTELSSA